MTLIYQAKLAEGPVTTNRVRQRGIAFILGAFVLGIMWASFGLEILFGT